MFNWLYRYKYTKRGIDNLMKYIVIVSAVVYALKFVGINLDYFLYFDSKLILSGQIWRLFTFVFITPASSSLIFAAFAFYFYYIIGQTLENDWGSFVFTVYYIITVLICAVIGFLTGGIIDNSYYVNLAMFLAYGFSFPENQVMLFMIIPIKMKYLAWAYAAFMVLWIITGRTLAPLCGLLSFILFFYKDLLRYLNIPSIKSKKKPSASRSSKKAHLHAVHKCEVCGRTENDDPDLQFRFCSRCRGYHEYCMEHLYTHEHK